MPSPSREYNLLKDFKKRDAELTDRLENSWKEKTFVVDKLSDVLLGI